MFSGLLPPPALVSPRTWSAPLLSTVSAHRDPTSARCPRTAGLLHYCFWYDGACVTWKVLSQWAGANLKLDFRAKPSPSHPAYPDSHFLVNSLGCLINSDCFNPGIFLPVKRMKIKYKSQIWVLWCVFGLCNRGLPWRREQKQTLIERV